MIEPQLREHLVTLTDAYAAAEGLSRSTVAERAARDHKFINKITSGGPRKGGEPSSFSVRKYDEVMAWFRDNWPKGTPWPAGVPRPKVAA